MSWASPETRAKLGLAALAVMVVFGGHQSLAQRARLSALPAAHGAPQPTPAQQLPVRLDNAAFPGSDAPDAVVHVPPGFDATRPVGVILYFHGWRGCADAALASHDVPCRAGGDARAASNLAAQIDDARVNALLVAVELRADMPTGEPGRLASPGALRRLLQELLSSRLPPTFGHPADVDALDRVVVIAHSGGYQATAAALTAGDLPQIREVVLLDALYGAEEVFARWIRDDAAGFASAQGPRLRWVDVYTCCAGTANASRALAHTVEPALRAAGADVTLDDEPGAVEPPVLEHAVVFKRFAGAHQELPRDAVRAIVEAAGFARLDDPNHKD